MASINFGEAEKKQAEDFFEADEEEQRVERKSSTSKLRRQTGGSDPMEAKAQQRPSNLSGSDSGKVSGSQKASNTLSSDLSSKAKSLEKKSLESALIRFSLARSRSSADSLRAMNIEKRIESRYFPFVAQGLKNDVTKFRSFSALYFNLAWIGRFCFIMVLIAALQLTPGLQVFAILLVNSAFFAYFLRCFFVLDIFASGISKWCGLYLEVVIELFFVITVVFFFNDTEGILSGDVFRVLQVLCIGMIYLGILLEVVSVVAEIIASTIEARRQRQEKEKNELKDAADKGMGDAEKVALDAELRAKPESEQL